MAPSNDPLSAFTGATDRTALPMHPELGVWGFRLTTVALCLLWAVCVVGREPLRAMAVTTLSAEGSAGIDSQLWRIAAEATMVLTEPLGWLRWVPLAALTILLAEAGVAYLAVSATWNVTRRRAQGAQRYYRVRTLSPVNRTALPDLRSGELWRALASAVRGKDERVALILSRSPNRPATLGIQLHSPSPLPTAAAEVALPESLARRRGGLQRRTTRGPVLPAPLPADARAAVPVGAISEARRVIEGVLKRADDTVMVEPADDPLRSAAKPGMALLSEDLTLRMGPNWPLRADTDDPGGLLRTMASSLAVPAGVVAQEYQIIVAPVVAPTSRRWYTRARWWSARLRRNDPMGLRPTTELTTLTEKLGDTPLALTIRLVVLVRSTRPDDLAAGRESLAVMRAALHGIESTWKLPMGSTVRQALVAAPQLRAPMRVPVAEDGPTQPPGLRRLLALGLGSAALVLLACLALGASYVVGSWRTAHDLPLWAGLALITVALAHGGIAAVTGLWRTALIQPWQAFLRVGRRQDTLDPLLAWSPLWRQPAILGSMEASRLWHLAGKQVEREVAWVPNRMLPVPESAFVPPGATDWLTIGHNFDSGGQLRPVGLPLKALHQMMHVTAGMGAGKSQAAAAMCAQLIPHGFIVLDGKGDDEGGSLAAVVRKLIPPSEEHRLTFLNVLETAYPIGLNPIYHFMVAMEQATSKADRDLSFNAALGLILGLFERLDPERWQSSPGMQQYALMGSHLVLRTGSSRPGAIPTMAKVARALEDATYRQSLIARYPFKTDLISRFWTERGEQLSEAQKTSLQALLRRLDLFMANPITRPMLTVERPSIDLQAAMDTGKIVFIPMPHRALGGLGPLVGMLVLQSLVAAAYARKGDALTRVTAPIFIDEVQVFIVNEQSPDLEQAFTQLRGFAVPLIVLHQTLDQLGKLESIFCINAANRLILRTGEPDASVYAKMYSQAGLKGEDIKAMEALHHQYAVTLGPNREQLVFSLYPNAWPTPPSIQLPPVDPALEWQTLSPPPDPRWSPDEAAVYGEVGRMIAEIIYRDPPPAAFERITGQFSKLPADLWDALLEQWDRMRAYHYSALLEHPALEPEQIRRQTWLTNLLASRGAVIEEALILRQELGLLAPAQSGTLSASISVDPAHQNPPPQDWQPRDEAARQATPALLAARPSAEELVRKRGVHPDEKPTIAVDLEKPDTPHARR